MQSLIRIFKSTLFITIFVFAAIKYFGYEDKAADIVDIFLHPQKYTQQVPLAETEPVEPAQLSTEEITTNNTNLLQQASISGNHQDQYEQTCTQNDSPLQKKAGTTIYSWVDENGFTQFGDKPPVKKAFEEKQLVSDGKDYFDVDIQYPGGNVPTGLGDTVAVGGRAIYKIYELYLPRNRIAKSQIDMRVYGSPDLYGEYRRAVAPRLNPRVTGFYSGTDNTVAVLHSNNVQQTRQIALHEIGHVIQFRNFGATPGWFGEGMAGYFENIEVTGQLATIGYNPFWLKILSQNWNRLPLNTLFTANYSYWQGDQGARYYGNSWAFVYFMMLPKNRKLMQDYQAKNSENKCETTNTIVFFNSHYPGGVAKLEQEWLAWLDGPHTVATTH